MCKPKNDGGLWVKDIHSFNLSFLGNGTGDWFCNTPKFTLLKMGNNPEEWRHTVRFSLERENLAQARESVFRNLKRRGLLSQASYSRPGERAQL
ncbi:hypothetical protein Lal_00000794 [Lupinus albus]|nr:hypothetical protein Lal_00000794 [Lupinus albus]